MPLEKENITHIGQDWNEEEIINRSKTDLQAFRLLYEKYYKKLFLFILHRTEEKEIAADLCQQVFLKALNGISKFQFMGLPFSTWLYRIAINECNDFFRKTKRMRCVTLDEAGITQLYDEITPDNRIEDLHRELPHLLQQLNTDEIQLIELRFFEKHSFKEIGDLLQITENYAKVRTYRVLDKMKKFFLSRNESKY